MQNQSTNYGGLTTVFFSADSLKKMMGLYRVRPPMAKAQKGEDTLVSFYRSAENPEQVVPALAAGHAKGALATKKDLKSVQAYEMPVAKVSYRELFDTFSDNKDIMELLGSIKTVEDAQSYFPS